VDEDRRTAFGRHMVATLTGGAMTMLVGLGYRTGLFEAAAQGPATSARLADRAGLQERYVREWLGAMVTGGFLDYDPGTAEYSLPAEHAPFLAGDTASNVTPMALMLRAFGGALPELEQSFAKGGGVPHVAFGPHFEAVGAVPGDTWRRIYDEQLVDGFLGAVPGLTGVLDAGASVLDLGCGSGHAVNVAAQAFPASRFVGLDIDERQIAAAGAECERLGLANAAFVMGDAATLPADPKFDVILAFDAIHDQHAPQEVLRNVRAALADGGVFVMVDAKFSSHLEHNVGNPLAPLCYAISLMYCTTVSLADGGAGLGAMWGTELACRMLADAGFGRVDVLDTPRPQNCLFVCRP
jgi:2-polyprenyl-3-methyl-5-hydroxy-6-metoxy-1,4-benzoquinol methylase